VTLVLLSNDPGTSGRHFWDRPETGVVIRNGGASETPCKRRSFLGIEVLRLRKNFAKRNSCCAQDDRAVTFFQERPGR
jgi:hypothetical protein